jgi:hypothetical protein
MTTEHRPLSLSEAVISAKKRLRRIHRACKKNVEILRCVDLIGNQDLRDSVTRQLVSGTRAAQIAWESYREIEDEEERRELWLEKTSDIELVKLAKRAFEEIDKTLVEDAAP